MRRGRFSHEYLLVLICGFLLYQSQQTGLTFLLAFSPQYNPFISIDPTQFDVIFKRQKNLGIFAASEYKEDNSRDEINSINDNEPVLEEEGEELIDITQVSDEEILLACRAYLQKRNRLEWTQATKRKRHAQLVDIRRKGEDGVGVGYFWENPDELLYLQSVSSANRRAQLEGGGNNVGNLTNINMLENEEDIYAESNEELENTEEYESTNDIKMDKSDTMPFYMNRYKSDVDQTKTSSSGDSFTSYHHNPSEEHLKRSLASRKRWSDPQFRQKWYAKRWGKKGKNIYNQETSPSNSIIPPSPSYSSPKHQKQLRKKLNSLPPTFWSSPLFSTLTEDELQKAVSTYILSNEKRSHTRKQKQKGGLRKWVQQEIEGGDVQFQNQNTEEALKERQRIRSERARRAYQTRLKNEELRQKIEEQSKTKVQDSTNKISKKETSSTTKTKKSSYAKSLTTLLSTNSYPNSKTTSKQNDLTAKGQAQKLKLQQKETMIQIEKCLDNKEFPSSLDVSYILSAARLKGRKPLLLRILKERFGLYGKCIPGDTSLGKESKMLFATKCNVDVLGSFLIEKLEERELGSLNA